MVDDQVVNIMDDLESGDDLAQDALDEANASFQSSAPISPKVNAAVGETLTALQNIVERNCNELDRVKEAMRVQRESLKNLFENDSPLAEAQVKASEVTQKLKERKSQIQATPEANQIKGNITELSERKKEIEEALNNHLLNLFQLTGTKTFDTISGQQREFTIKASVVGSRKPGEAIDMGN